MKRWQNKLNKLISNNYKPIACYKVIYKCITKVLAADFNLFPNQFQSAFVKARAIVDTILLMQELLRNYHKDELPVRCAIKVDLVKSCDFVAFFFLFDVMEAMEFPQMFIHWIKQCVTTPRFYVVINGELEGI